MKKLGLLFVSCLIVMTGYAQDIEFEVIRVAEGQMVFYGNERDIVMSDSIPDYQIKGWNPSGRYFMTFYTEPTETDPFAETLLLHDLSIPEAFPMMTDMDVDATSPIYFGNDRVVFMEREGELLVSEDEQGLGVITYNLHEWRFDDGLFLIRKLGHIPYGVGCGGSGVRSTIDNVYSKEVRGDTFGEYNRKVLAPTPYGIVHSNSCTAIRTLLTNPETLDFVELSDNLRWATVSPDGQWLTGVNNNILELINLETLDIIPISEGDAPTYSVIWADDSQSFYFVERTHEDEQLPIADPNNRLEQYDPFDTRPMPRPEDALMWTNRIVHYVLNTDVSTELHRSSAYAIGEMTLVEGTLVFSQVEYPIDWLNLSLNVGENYDADLIPVTTWQLDLATTETIQIADNWRGVWVRPN